MLTEAQQKKLKRMIDNHLVVEGCPQCEVFFENPDALAPDHKPNPECGNAKFLRMAPQPHCTCDGCF